MKFLPSALALSVSTLFAQAPNPAPVPPDTVVMKVAGHPLTAAEVTRLIATFAPDIQGQLKRDPQSVMQSYFLMEKLARDAEQEKLDQQSPVRETLALQRLQTLAGALINRKGESITVSDEDARARFELDKNNKYRQAKVRAILVKYGGEGLVQHALDMSDPNNPKPAPVSKLRTQPEAVARCAEIEKKLKAGADFATLAKEMSDDTTTAANGGLFPILRQSDKMPDDVRNQIFTLNPGEVSEPLRQPLGYYILKVEEQSIMPLEEAMPAVKGSIKQERFEQWMAEARKAFEVTVESPEYFGIQKPPAKSK